ncbi:MAG: sulfotransferase family 2 domain-containing protein [Candidatus Thorarchaeota archaeon]|jgi:hypothetical protein
MNINDLQYIHIPKTGGWSITNLLKELGYNNFSGHKFAKDIEGVDGRFLFTIVRNPWSRLVSSYTFLTSGSEIHRPPEGHTLDNLNISNFKDFVNYLNDVNEETNDCYILPNDKHNRINLFTLNQVNWVFNGNANSIVDYIGKMNCIVDSMKELSELTDIDLTNLKKTNTTKHDNFRDLYDDESISLVANLYKKDITHFNFRFDD